MTNLQKQILINIQDENNFINKKKKLPKDLLKE